jgi:hypothetical protein
MCSTDLNRVFVLHQALQGRDHGAPFDLNVLTQMHSSAPSCWSMRPVARLSCAEGSETSRSTRRACGCCSFNATAHLRYGSSRSISQSALCLPPNSANATSRLAWLPGGSTCPLTVVSFFGKSSYPTRVDARSMWTTRFVAFLWHIVEPQLKSQTLTVGIESVRQPFETLRGCSRTRRGSVQSLMHGIISYVARNGPAPHCLQAAAVSVQFPRRLHVQTAAD